MYVYTQVGAERVKFHKAVLAAHSDQLAAYLVQKQNVEEVYANIINISSFTKKEEEKKK